MCEGHCECDHHLLEVFLGIISNQQVEGDAPHLQALAMSFRMCSHAPSTTRFCWGRLRLEKLLHCASMQKPGSLSWPYQQSIPDEMQMTCGDVCIYNLIRLISQNIDVTWKAKREG